MVSYFQVAILFLLSLSLTNSTVINPHPASPNFRVAESCEYILEVVLVQDITYSYLIDIETLQAELPLLVSIVLGRFPGSRFALTCFTDKPAKPLGYNTTSWKDFCLSVRSTLLQPHSKFMTAVSKLTPGGGLDFPEAQLDAMMRAIVTDAVGWSNSAIDPVTGKTIIRVILLATDSIFHGFGNLTQAIVNINANSGSSLQLPTSNTLLSNPSAVQTNVNAQCGTMEYPTVSQLGQAFVNYKVLPIFLLAPAGFPCRRGFCTYPELDQWGSVDPIFKDPTLGMLRVYSDLLHDMGITGIIQTLGESYEGFGEKLSLALEEMTGIICSTSTSTTSTTTQTTTSSSTVITTTTTTTTTTSSGPTTTTTTLTTSSSTPTTLTTSTSTPTTLTTSTSTSTTLTTSTSTSTTTPTTPTRTTTTTTPTTNLATTTTPCPTKPCPCDPCVGSCCSACGGMDVDVNIAVNINGTPVIGNNKTSAKSEKFLHPTETAKVTRLI